MTLVHVWAFPMKRQLRGEHLTPLSLHVVRLCGVLCSCQSEGLTHPLSLSLSLSQRLKRSHLSPEKPLTDFHTHTGTHARTTQIHILTQLSHIHTHANTQYADNTSTHKTNTCSDSHSIHTHTFTETKTKANTKTHTHTRTHAPNTHALDTQTHMH